MANPKLQRSENIQGSFFVDSTCIDCGTCYWMAPDTFKELGGMSAVTAQPQSQQQVLAAARALVSCPVGSIGTREHKASVQKAIQSFPFNLEDNVFHCGFHSESSFGATSYYIQEKDNSFMIDSPRFSAPLIKGIEKLGAPTKMLLTHIDDVADHEKFQKHFGLDRFIHEADQRGSAKNTEQSFKGSEPIQLNENMTVIPTPGHSKGQVCFLYKNKFLFTGDHLAWDLDSKKLVAFYRHCWFDWKTQITSMEKLLDYSFEWVLPGHGDPIKLPADQMKEELLKCIAWMKTK